MIRWSFARVLVVLLGGVSAAADLYGKASSSCPDYETCTYELPGAECADGTPMFLNITRRPNATKLYIYLQGGGACWDSVSCDCHGDRCYGGTARNLTRPEPKNTHSGWTDLSVPANPITADYNVVEVPYCTGDLFMGNRMRKLGNPKHPVTLKQFGYRNITTAFAATKKLFPSPDSIIVMGSSAGGLGAMFNLHQLRRFYERSPAYVISDAGAPFKVPYVSAEGVDRLISSWGVVDILPPDYSVISPGPVDFAGLLRYNAARFPHDRFAFISSYNDWVMTVFSILLGAEYGFSTIGRMIRDVAANDLGEMHKVFYVGGDRHTFHNVPPSDVLSGQINLSDWVSKMITGKPDWINQL
jgi:hypothetical protein